MATDPSLYARNTDPETSHAAARALRNHDFVERAGRWLYDHDRPEGWTWSEIESAVEPDLFGACPWHRFSDLRRRFLAEWVVDDTGRKIVRAGQYGRSQGAVRLTNKGQRRYFLADLRKRMEK